MGLPVEAVKLRIFEGGEFDADLLEGAVPLLDGVRLLLEGLVVLQLRAHSRQRVAEVVSPRERLLCVRDPLYQLRELPVQPCAAKSARAPLWLTSPIHASLLLTHPFDAVILILRTLTDSVLMLSRPSESLRIVSMKASESKYEEADQLKKNYTRGKKKRAYFTLNILPGFL